MAPTQQPSNKHDTSSYNSNRDSNPVRDDASVSVATRTDFEDTESIVAALTHQETRTPLDESNCCNAGPQEFRIYNTNLPIIRREDIIPGTLIYRPTTRPLHVYEILTEPYTNEHGADQVDVRVHEKTHNGPNPNIRTRKDTLFTNSIIDQMTFFAPQTVQTELPTH